MTALRVAALLVAIVLLGVVTVGALREVGYFGIIAPLLQPWGGLQVGIDFTIFAVLACLWMIADGRTRGLTAWPFVVLVVLGGSFGVLFYLLRRELVSTTTR